MEVGRQILALSNIYFEGRSLFIRPDKHPRPPPAMGGRGAGGPPIGRGGHDASFPSRGGGFAGPRSFNRGSMGYGGMPAPPPDPFTDNVVGDGERSETIFVRNVSSLLLSYPPSVSYLAEITRLTAFSHL